MADKKKTGAETHRATQRGYVVDSTSKAGVLIEPGEIVPAGIPVGEWMEPIKKGEVARIAAAEEATDKHPKDVDLTKLDTSALQAMAAERGINVEQAGKKLSKADLIAAINAKVESDAG